MSVVSIPNPALHWRWLRNVRFDPLFIIGLPAAGILTGLFVTWRPEAFWPILVFDLWFLGYHHVVSTYTRLCFDKESFRRSRFLIFGLLPLVAVATLAIAEWVGLWAIVSVYFYWQWFHYARQSWGISRAYRGKEREALYEDGWIDQAIFWALPVLGMLYRSYWAVLGTLNAWFFAGLSATIVLYQIVNFHHYVVDALIWKGRQAPVRQTAGSAG